MESKDLFDGDDPNSYMMLCLLNTLSNAGIIPKKDRDDIIDLGYMIKGIATNKKNNKQIEAAKELAKQLIQLKGKED